MRPSSDLAGASLWLSLIGPLEEECARSEWSERRTAKFLALNVVVAIAGFVLTGELLWLLATLSGAVAVNWCVRRGLRAVNQRQFYQELKQRIAADAAEPQGH